MILAFAMTITVLMNDQGHQDDARVVHQKVMPMSECLEWQEANRRSKHNIVDTITSRKVAAVYYECVPVRPNEMIAMLGAK